MTLMGDKQAARRTMIAAGVPVVPGVDTLDSGEAALVAAQEIGFPVMLKAVAGGGGKGMRVVTAPEELVRAFEAASREASAAFGDGRMFMERAVMRARHVEIQLMADNHGEVVYLNERECSVQRRHQKVIEECPSPSAQMSPRIRAAMGEVAVKVAKAVGYRGAGTVEFLFEEGPDGPTFFFLEMNTRLQVEHAVTEATCGRDLVWDQIRVAAGEPLGYTQAEVELRGHAIECRLYAEDPSRFLPAPGDVHKVRWPTGAHIRVDTAVASGSVVSRHYDPMIAKLTVWGPDRPSALARMREALRTTVLLGISTNIPFHLRVLEEPDFLAGQITTRYIDEHPGLLTTRELDDDVSRAAAAAAVFARTTRARQHASAGGSEGAGEAVSPWRRAASWRGR
jgi:acetyl/propionyl-CoA carboxylase alpha subunit